MVWRWQRWSICYWYTVYLLSSTEAFILTVVLLYSAIHCSSIFFFYKKLLYVLLVADGWSVKHILRVEKSPEHWEKWVFPTVFPLFSHPGTHPLCLRCKSLPAHIPTTLVQKETVGCSWWTWRKTITPWAKNLQDLALSWLGKTHFSHSFPPVFPQFFPCTPARHCIEILRDQKIRNSCNIFSILHVATSFYFVTSLSLQIHIVQRSWKTSIAKR